MKEVVPVEGVGCMHKTNELTDELTKFSTSLWGIFLSLLALLLPLNAPAAAAPEAEAQEEEFLVRDASEIINLRIQRDMMYGTDDFFGEDTDLSYVDGVTPSAAETTAETTPSETAGQGGSSKPPEVGPTPPPEEPPPPPEEPPPI
jgi:hypothetical protein